MCGCVIIKCIYIDYIIASMGIVCDQRTVKKSRYITCPEFVQMNVYV